MRAKILTLRYSPQLGRFDDAALVSLQQKIVLEGVREHLVTVGGEPMLVCLAEWRERVEAGGACSGPTTTPASIAAAPRKEPAPQPAEAPTGSTAAPVHSSGPATPVGELRADLTAEQQVLFDLLRRWRRQKAHTEGAPPYVILTNRQLVELVRQRPHSKSAMAQIPGLGDKKLARHGTELLALLWPDAPANEQSIADAAPGEQEATS